MQISFGKISGLDLPRERLAEGTPLRIALLADLSGRSSSSQPVDAARLAGLRPRKISFETLEDSLAEIAPRLEFFPPDDPLGDLAFAELDDFHPDAICRQLDSLTDLPREQAADRLRSLLRDSAFRRLEETWRGLDWLLRRTSKGNIELVAFDLTAVELVDDMQSQDDLQQTALFRLLVEGQAESVPFGLIVVDFPFELTDTEIASLGRLAQIGLHLNAPILAGTTAAAVGEGSPLAAQTQAGNPNAASNADPWEALRQLPASAFLAVAAPRFLLRLPFGENYRSCEALPFEEFDGSPDCYVWGNPALAAAAAIVREFIKLGWKLELNGARQLENMPVHAFRTPEGDEASTLTELRLSPTLADTLAQRGITTLTAVRGRDILEIPALRSLSAAVPTLAGRWNEGAGVSSQPAPPATPEATSEPAAEFGLDPELAALLGSTVAEPAPSPTPADELPPLDPELAALLGTADEPTDSPSKPADPLSGPADLALDPELAALLADAETTPPRADLPELDPELAALLGETTTEESTVAPESLEFTAPPDDLPPADELQPIGDLDAELAALLAADPEPPPPPPEADSGLDPELAALLAAADEPSSSPAADSGLDPELAALLGAADEPSPTPNTAALDAAAFDPELAALLAADTPPVEPPAITSPAPLAPLAPAIAPVSPAPPRATATVLDPDNEGLPLSKSAPMATDLADLDALIVQAQSSSKYGANGSPPLLDFKALLQPIPGDDPAGGSVPFTIREELEQARKEINPASFGEDDPTRPTDIVRADWSKIISVAKELLAERSKNLLVAARLLEALTKKHGFAGVRDGLHLMRLMVEVCWDRLEPPIEDDDLEVRAGPFHWLDDPDRGATYPNTLKNTPLVIAGPDTYSWQQWNLGLDGRSSLSADLVEKAIRTTTREQCQRTADDVSQALQELKWLGQSLRERMGPEAPGLAAIRPVLEECRNLAQQILQRKGPSEVNVMPDSPSTDGVAVVVSPAAPRLGTREAVYQQLSEAAEALQRIEPHSPVPFLILKAVELGNLSFPQLMAALIRDSSVLAEMNRELGIRPPS